MKMKATLPPLSFYCKLSIIITTGILITAFLALNVAYGGAKRISLKHYMETGETNMEHVRAQLLNVHTHVSAACEGFCTSSQIITAFTISPDSPSPELSESLLEAENRIGGLWNFAALDNTVFAAIGKNGFSLSSDNWGLRISNKQFLASPVLDACRQNPLVLKYVPLPESIMGSNQNAPSLVAVRSLKTPMGKTPFGLLMIQFSQAYFNDICEPFRYPQSQLLITDANGRILSGDSVSGDSFFTPFSTVLHQNGYRREGLSDHVRIGNADDVVLYQYVPYMDLYLFNVINKGKITDEFYSSIKGALLLAGLLTAVLLFLAAIITSGITRPLKRFTAQLLKNYDSCQNDRLPVEGSRETRQLAKAYNRMADEIKYYNEKLMDTEKKRHEAELTALQLQINPHFLYNTLASIKYLVLKGNSVLAGKAIHSLIAMLRGTIGKTGEFTTVREQMENLKHYTDIMSLRYDNAIPVFYVIHPGCLSALMPKLLLQPLVENAFFHAFDKSGGYVKVLAALASDGRLVCEIIDNGRGFIVPEELKKDVAAKLYCGPHIGLLNVKQRLALIYGVQSSFTVNSQPGKGTLIKIELPFRPL